MGPAQLCYGVEYGSSKKNSAPCFQKTRNDRSATFNQWTCTVWTHLIAQSAVASGLSNVDQRGEARHCDSSAPSCATVFALSVHTLPSPSTASVRRSQADLRWAGKGPGARRGRSGPGLDLAESSSSAGSAGTWTHSGFNEALDGVQVAVLDGPLQILRHG